MRKLRVLVMMDESLVPPDSVEGMSGREIAPFKTEYDVVNTLRNCGHEVRPVGVKTDLSVLANAIADFRPHICFNLVEDFDGIPSRDQHVVSYLELINQSYTGANPRGLTLSRDKALTKKILSYHGILTPRFAVFPVGRVIRRPQSLGFPLLVKSLTQEGSVGISQASVIYSDQQLAERVAFLHERFKTDVIAEQYIEGRELYVSVMGNRKLQTFPIWEL
jgi:D-alanine-D-alanine ligase